MTLATPAYLRELAAQRPGNTEGFRDGLKDGADEIERLVKERDELFLENGKLANTLGATSLRMRSALVAMRSRDDQNGSLPPAYRWIIDVALAEEFCAPSEAAGKS